MANQYTKRKLSIPETDEAPPRAVVTASEDLIAKAKADRDATPPAPEPEAIPVGDLFTVRAFGQDGKRIQQAEASVFNGTSLAPCSHADAVEACTKANESKIAETGAVWFGVVEAES